jgi:hypothetical protein
MNGGGATLRKAIAATAVAALFELANALDTIATDLICWIHASARTTLVLVQPSAVGVIVVDVALHEFIWRRVDLGAASEVDQTKGIQLTTPTI